MYLMLFYHACRSKWLGYIKPFLYFTTSNMYFNIEFLLVLFLFFAFHLFVKKNPHLFVWFWCLEGEFNTRIFDLISKNVKSVDSLILMVFVFLINFYFKNLIYSQFKHATINWCTYDVWRTFTVRSMFMLIVSTCDLHLRKELSSYQTQFL